MSNVTDIILKEWCNRLPRGFPTMKHGKFENTKELDILKQIISETILEARTDDSTALEKALYHKWIGAKLADSEKNWEPVINKIIKSLAREIGLPATGAVAKHLGSASYPTTTFWSSYGAKDKTPKTDIILNGEKISLKVGESQLMSGGKSESIATFYAAMLDQSIKLGKNDKDEIERMIDGFGSGLTKQGNISQALKKEKILKDIDELHKNLAKKLESVFSTNSAFARAFVREALSGENKFGPDSEATAEKIFSIQKKSGDSDLYTIVDADFLDNVAEKVKITVRFKSQSQKKKNKTTNTLEKTGKYKFWSVLSLVTKKLNECEQDLSSGLITESVFVDKIKSFVIKVFNWLKSKIIELVDSGLDMLIDFLQFESDDIDIDYNDEINFSMSQLRPS